MPAVLLISLPWSRLTPLATASLTWCAAAPAGLGRRAGWEAVCCTTHEHCCQETQPHLSGLPQWQYTLIRDDFGLGWTAVIPLQCWSPVDASCT